MSKPNYRKIFEIESVRPSEAELDKLAWLMSGNKQYYTGDEEVEKSIFENVLGFVRKTLGNFAEIFMLGGSENNETDKLIPAGYTYLGQFITHDISLDCKTERNKKAHHAWEDIKTEDIRNLRNPVFDLEIIYGHETKLEGDIYIRKDLLEENSAMLKIGETIAESDSNPNVNKVHFNDLNRNQWAEAIIADPRNDENLILAQMQVAFTKFHNAVAKGLTGTPEEVFEQAREIVIKHYQYIIWQDFLPKIVQPEILREVEDNFRQTKKNRFYDFENSDFYLPLEFAVGAFRFGHSMIRNEYNLNIKNIVKLPQLFEFTGKGGELLEKKLRSQWVINWRWFFDIDNSKSESKFNFAEKLNPQYASILGRLIPVFNVGKANSLSAIDLYRGMRWQLPTGQAVADEIKKKVNIRKLDSQTIKNTFDDSFTEIEKDNLSQQTPFIYYLLLEAQEQTGGEKLGDVGSWIVAEVFIKLLYESPNSIWEADFENDESFLGKDGNKFGMAEMLKFTKKVFNENYDEVIDPIGQGASS